MEHATKPETSLRSPIRWVGGKTQIAGHLRQHLPEAAVRPGTHIEPFCGGASLYLSVASGESAILADANGALIDFWKCLRNDPDGLIRAFRSFAPPTGPADYVRVRDTDPQAMPFVLRAGWFLYLNHFGFNGLWRVNRSGRMNAAWGGEVRASKALNESALLNVSQAIQRVEFNHCDFRHTLSRAEAGDFVYLDPPYVSEASGGQVRYSAAGFGDQDHRDLSYAIAELIERGVAVMMSNSGLQRTKELYRSSKLRWKGLQVRRSVSARPEGRRQVSELVGTNYSRSALAVAG